MTTEPTAASGPAGFAGYGDPFFTQIPNVFIDIQMPDLSGSEVKVMLYIFRRTWGYQRDSESIALSDFLEGRQARSGRPLDRGVGITQPSLYKALQALEARGYIFRHQQTNSRMGNTPTFYEVNRHGLPHCTERCAPDCRARPPVPSNLTEGVVTNLGEGFPTNLPEPAPNNLGELSTIERKIRKEKGTSPDENRHIPLTLAITPPPPTTSPTRAGRSATGDIDPHPGSATPALAATIVAQDAEMWAPPILPAAPNADSNRLWQLAILNLQALIGDDAYLRVLRYTRLLELDRTAGAVLLGVPNEYMRAQIVGHLAAPIAGTLGQLCGSPIRVFAIVLPGPGHLADQWPTLAALLEHPRDQGERT